MGVLGKKYFEIGRGYVQVNDTHKCPYLLGVDINAIETPFVVAKGDHHSETAASLISPEELISSKWEDHVIKSNSKNFVDKLKQAMENQEAFPQQFIIDLVNQESKI